MASGFASTYMCMEKVVVATAQVIGLSNNADDDEEEDDEKLRCWRPIGAEAQMLASHKRKKHDKDSDSSEDDAASKAGSEQGSIASSISKQMSDSDPGSGDDDKSDGSASQDSDKQDGSSEDDDSDAEAEALEQARRDAEKKKNKKMVIRMRFDPLLELHEPLEKEIQEPAELFSQTKKKRKTLRAERAAIDDVLASYRRKAKDASEKMADMGLDECQIAEIAQACNEDVDEFRFALVQSKRFTVSEDGVVRKSLIQRILDVMESDIETLQEVLDKLMTAETAEVKEAIHSSEGQLRIKNVNDIDLIEAVDLEKEARLAREQEKEDRRKDKEEKRLAKAKRGRKNKQEEQEEESESSSEGDADGNQEAERKALAFRRVQVERKIEDFLQAYTKGQNLTKITGKGKRYHRRVYVDTTRKALVVQGASGPKFFPFASMKEVDMETRTSKEGRAETVVICAIAKRGRIVKELQLAFPDQAKANTFVNCVSLFSATLRTKDQ